jgi:sodium transport system permease protein
LSLELAGSLGRWFFLPLPKHVTRVLQSLGDAQQPLWFVLLAFAVLPPICEELAFRGFILSGFRKSGRVWLAIVLSSLSFGVMHMIPQQAFNAALLGLVLGLIAVRSQSIFPCIFFHMVFNGLAICRERFLVGWHAAHPSAFLVEVDGQLRYAWITLAIAGILSVLLLRYLVRQPHVSGRDPERPVAEHARLADHARFAAVPTASGPGIG